MHRILVVNSDPKSNARILSYVEHDGFETTGLADGTEAVNLCCSEDFDLVVMDTNVTGTDAFSACREIRAAKDIPVLLILAKEAQRGWPADLDTGVKGYLVRPYLPKDLMKRIREILRSRMEVWDGSRRCFGDLEMDPRSRKVWVQGEELPLTTMQFEVLLCLARSRGIPVSREEILREVWKEKRAVDVRRVDWQIKLVRSKLGPCRNRIRAVRGVGYRFDG